jgi:hypothetical protein
MPRTLLDTRNPTTGDGLLITYEETGGPPHTTRAIPVVTIADRDGQVSVCGDELRDLQFALLKAAQIAAGLRERAAQSEGDSRAA